MMKHKMKNYYFDDDSKMNDEIVQMQVELALNIDVNALNANPNVWNPDLFVDGIYRNMMKTFQCKGFV